MSRPICDICEEPIYLDDDEDWEFDEFDQPCHSWCLDEETGLDYDTIGLP